MKKEEDYPSREELLRRHSNKITKYWLIFYGIIGSVILLFVIIARTNPTEPIQQEQQTEIPQFSPWDGSHINLTRYIKESMNNPDSYEHVRTSYWEIGEGKMVVRTVFRGTNAFGAVVTQSIKAEVDSNGKILKVFE